MGPMRAAVGLMRAEKKTFLWDGKLEINRLCIDITFFLRCRWIRGFWLRIGSCSGNANGGRVWTLYHLIMREQSRAGSWFCGERNQCLLLLWRKLVQFKSCCWHAYRYPFIGVQDLWKETSSQGARKYVSRLKRWEQEMRNDCQSYWSCQSNEEIE